MILNQLRVCALGPYKEEETICFEKLNKAKLFAISGNTGAGKTAIFDGVCFALYGKASGQHRNNVEEIRCVHANDETYTEAVLEFSLRNQQYRARRQMGHVKKNNKTKTGGANELHRWVSSGADKEGRWESMLESGKVNEMNERIIELVGLDDHQFRQIVMLPQGEFEKLLLAKAEDKKGILRKIFNTSLYQRFTEKLDRRRREADKAYHVHQQNIQLYENSLYELLKEEALEIHALFARPDRNPIQVLEALNQDIKTLGRLITKDEKQLTEMEREIKKADEYYHKAKQDNERLEELEKQQQMMELLKQEKKEKDYQQINLTLAQKAQKIDYFHRRRQETHQEYEKKQKILAEMSGLLEKAKKQWEEDEKQWEILKQEKDEMLKQQEELIRLNGYLPKVKKMTEVMEEIRFHQELKGKMQKKHTQMKLELEEKQHAIERLSEERDKIAAVLEKETDIYQQQNQLLRQKENLKEALIRVKEIKKLQEKKKDAENKYHECKKKADKMETSWMESQAFLLAKSLKEGDMCPVCGSTEHPQKALSSGDQIGKEDLEFIRIKLSEAGEICATINTKLEEKEKALKKTLVNLEQEVADTEQLQVLEEQVNEKIHEIYQFQQEIVVSKKRNETIKKVMEEHQKEIKALIGELETHSKKVQKLEEEIALYQGKRKSIEEEVPPNLLELSELEKKIKTLKSQVEKWQTAFQNTEEKKNTSKEALVVATSNLKNAEENAKEAKECMKESKCKWMASRKKEGFDTDEDFIDAHMQEEQLKQIQDELQDYQERWKLTEETIRKMEVDLKNVKKANLRSLDQHRQQIREEHKSLQLAIGHRSLIVKESVRLSESIENEWGILKKVEENRNRITDLYANANGTGNDQKLALETYVLQHYFQRVLVAANQRLDELTMGRYQLVTDEEKEKHGGRSGLGIAVIDSFNEQNRSVRTLSGGEKFNASLCLALGLFDVIQSESGGTEMKTMFIDEGFGSLDSHESLPRAIQMLNRIQETGRVIGVISHVGEIREQLPAVLEVHKRPDGTSTTNVRIN